MPLLISHGSALERLRAVPPLLDHSSQPTQDVPTKSLRTEPLRIRSLASKLPGIPTLPVNILIAAGTSYRPSPSIRVHTTCMQSVPAELLRELCPQVFIAGPELTFAQMAKTLSPIGTIVLGYELCGSYSHFYKRASGYYERPPLTSTSLIQKALENLGSMRGLGKIGVSLRYVLNGSASPMETVMACMLSLPRRMGGFGCTSMELNKEIPLDEVASALTGTKTCRIDAAFPRHKIGFEYDSLTHHLDPAADRRRREALSHLGWTIYTVDLNSITQASRLKNIVRLLEGTVLRSGTLDLSDDVKSRDLLSRLLKATRYRMGINGLLFSVDVPPGKVNVHL